MSKSKYFTNKRNFSTDSISDSQIGKLLKENTRNSELDHLTENEEDDELDSYSNYSISCDENKEDDNAEEIKKLKKTSTNKHHQQQYRIEWEKNPKYSGWLKPDKNNKVILNYSIHIYIY
jgi:hypothetical protein